MPINPKNKKIRWREHQYLSNLNAKLPQSQSHKRHNHLRRKILQLSKNLCKRTLPEV
jgi:hypothetical protein